MARLGESSRFIVDASKTAQAPIDARLPIGELICFRKRDGITVAIKSCLISCSVAKSRLICCKKSCVLGQQQPIVQPIPGRDRVYSVNFSPHGKAGDVLPLEVMYDGQPVNGRYVQFQSADSVSSTY